MTSNLGSHLIQESIEMMSKGNPDEVMDSIRNSLFELLRKTIRPEFLNRIDETIVFTPLSRDDINEIVKLQFNQVVKRLADSGLKMTITDSAIELLAKLGYEPQFGARPVKRVLQRYLLNELSRKVLAGDIDKSNPIRIDTEGDKLVFRN